MTDNGFKQVLAPIQQLQQQAEALQSKTSDVFTGLTNELVGAGNAVMNAAGQVTSAVTGFISGAENAFSNFITRITPKELLSKRSGIEGFLPATSKITAAKGKITSSSNLFFPLRPSNAKYKLRLGFREYSRPSAMSPPKIAPLGAITLPIPADLLESHNISYDTESSGIAGALWNSFTKDGAEGVQSGVRQGLRNGDFTQATAALSKSWDGVSLDPKTMSLEKGNSAGRTAALYYAQTSVPKSIYDLGTQILGEIPNPHPTVLFRGVSLRKYTFSFRLYPTSADESKALRKIINKLKEYSLPSYSNNTEKNLFKYPMMVYPEFIVPGQSGKTENGKEGGLATSIPFGFKYCVIERISVQYAPSGAPAFFAGGKGETTGVTLTLDLQEIEVQTSEDYKEGGSSSATGSFTDVGSLISSLGLGSDVGSATSIVADAGGSVDGYVGPATQEALSSDDGRSKIVAAFNDNT